MVRHRGRHSRGAASGCDEADDGSLDARTRRRPGADRHRRHGAGRTALALVRPRGRHHGRGPRSMSGGTWRPSSTPRRSRCTVALSPRRGRCPPVSRTVPVIAARRRCRCRGPAVATPRPRGVEPAVERRASASALALGGPGAGRRRGRGHRRAAGPPLPGGGGAPDAVPVTTPGGRRHTGAAVAGDGGGGGGRPPTRASPSQSGPEAAVPIASLTKIMTAYLTLRDHPLAPTRPGPHARHDGRRSGRSARPKRRWAPPTCPCSRVSS